MENDIKYDKDISLLENLNEYKSVTCKNEQYERLKIIFIYNKTTSHTGRTKIDTGTTNSTSINTITDKSPETGNVHRIE